MGRPLYRTTENTQIGTLTNRMDAVERRRDVSGFYEIKVVADGELVQVGSGAFIFAIPNDLSGSKLRSANAFVTTIGADATVIMINNATEALDLLLVPITIDAGNLDAQVSAAPAEIDATMYGSFSYPRPNNEVRAMDQISIDVLQDGDGAMGLGVMLGFS